MKDNFSNSNPFGRNKSKYSEHLENYIGMVNQPTAADAFGDAFSQAGSAPAVGAQAHEANALLSGIGAGIKGAANSQRQEKLSPYMQLTAQLTAKAAELEAQMQEEQQHQAQVNKVFRQAAPIMMERSKASMVGDTQAVSKMDKAILDIYKQIMKDPSVGDYSHSNDGSLYYTNNDTGVIEGRNPIHLMHQAGINPADFFGQDAPMIEASYSPGAKLKYENTLETNRLALEKERANISNTNAQTGVYKAQAEKTQKEASTPKVNEHVANKTFDTNVKWMDEQDKVVDNSILKNKVFDKLEQILKRESAAGGTPWDALKRYYKGKTGNDKDLTEAKLLQKYFFADIKGVAGNPNAKEWEDLVGRIISTGQNVDGALSVLGFERELNNEAINRYHATVEELQANDYGLLYNDPRIQAKVKERVGGTPTQNNVPNQATSDANVNQQQGMVQMQAPDGSTRAVPVDQVEKWKSRGATIVNE